MSKVFQIIEAADSDALNTALLALYKSYEHVQIYGGVAYDGSNYILLVSYST